MDLFFDLLSIYGFQQSEVDYSEKAVIREALESNFRVMETSPFAGKKVVIVTSGQLLMRKTNIVVRDQT